MGKSAAVVPAVAPVTEPAPLTPEETDRTLVTGSNPEESERRRPVEEPLASPELLNLLDMFTAAAAASAATAERSVQQLLRLGSAEKESTTAELPATAPVSVPVPVTVPSTPDRAWRVWDTRKCHSPMDEYFGSARGSACGSACGDFGRTEAEDDPPLMD